MFNILKDKNTGLTDEEKKMAAELNEAIEKKQSEEREDNDKFEKSYELAPESRLAHNIAGHLAEVTAERFSDMIDGIDMPVAKQIVNEFKKGDDVTTGAITARSRLRSWNILVFLM